MTSTNAASSIGRARELLGRDAVDFDADRPGTNVVGEVVWIRDTTTEYGIFPSVTLDDGVRLVTILCARKVLHQQFLAHEVRVGDVLGIEYRGQRKGKKGHRYHVYRLVHVPSTGTSALSGEGRG